MNDAISQPQFWIVDPQDALDTVCQVKKRGKGAAVTRKKVACVYRGAKARSLPKWVGGSGAAYIPPRDGIRIAAAYSPISEQTHSGRGNTKGADAMQTASPVDGAQHSLPEWPWFTYGSTVTARLAATANRGLNGGVEWR